MATALHTKIVKVCMAQYLREEWIAEAKLAHLRQQINIGLTQLDEEQGVTIETRESLNHLMEAIKAEA